MEQKDIQKIQKMIDATIETRMKNFFDQYITFTATKLGDTPTDVRQLVPKGFLEEFYLALAGGTLAEGAAIELGTITGTKIGTAANQKLGFFGKTPIVQPTNTAGNVSAGATYGASEQKMLNDSYQALRALGLLS